MMIEPDDRFISIGWQHAQNEEIKREADQQQDKKDEQAINRPDCSKESTEVCHKSVDVDLACNPSDFPSSSIKL